MPTVALQSAQSRRIWISAGAPILGLVVIVVAAAFWLVADMARRQDDVWTANARALVANAVEGGAQALNNTTADYAYWNDAYDNVAVRWRQNWIDNNLYSSVTDGIIVFDTSRRVRHAWFNALEGDAANAIARAAALAATDEELQHAAAVSETVTIKHFTRVDGELVGVSMAPISREDEAQRRLSGAQTYYLASIDVLDAAEIAERGEALGMQAMALTEAPGPERAFVSLPLFGPAGKAIGYLSWRNERPGSAEFASRFQPILLGLAAIGLLATLVARFLAQRQIQAMARAATALESSRLKSEFIATMSHELRTPLHAIIGYAELIEEQASPDDPQSEEIRSDSGKIARAAQHLLGLINNIIEHARIDSALLTRLEPVSVVQTLAEVEEIVRPLAKSRGNKVLFETGATAALVQADPARLRQVLLNLIGNAIKFTHNGQIHVSIGTFERDGQPFTTICVADTGIGIAPEALPRLFAPFVQADSSITRLYGGSGLGLSISRKLARAMGGDIVAESTPGQGSIFTLSLPSAPLAMKLAA